MERGFLGLVTGGDEAGQGVDEKKGVGAAMAAVFDLADVRELIVATLDEARVRRRSVSGSVSRRWRRFFRALVTRGMPWATSTCWASAWDSHSARALGANLEFSSESGTYEGFPDEFPCRTSEQALSNRTLEDQTVTRASSS